MPYRHDSGSNGAVALKPGLVTDMHGTYITDPVEPNVPKIRRFHAQ
jgi:hypothetical protein